LVSEEGSYVGARFIAPSRIDRTKIERLQRRVNAL
jgi:hypothetical protein